VRGQVWGVKLNGGPIWFVAGLNKRCIPRKEYDKKIEKKRQGGRNPAPRTICPLLLKTTETGTPCILKWRASLRTDTGARSGIREYSQRGLIRVAKKKGRETKEPELHYSDGEAGGGKVLSRKKGSIGKNTLHSEAGDF